MKLLRNLSEIFIVYRGNLQHANLLKHLLYFYKLEFGLPDTCTI